MWNVKIRDKGVADEAITVQVEFTKDSETIVRNFSANSQSAIDQKIISYRDALKKRDEDFDSVAVGDWIDPTQEEVTPTQEELEAQAWVEQWEIYTKAKLGMEALAEAGAEPTPEELASFEALKTWLVSNRKSEYTHLI